MRDIAFETQALKIMMGHDERERCRALVDLAALDANAAVLDDVDSTES
jgi:hypothetical protein